MEKIQLVRHGKYTLRGHGKRTEDGRFLAAFAVVEHLPTGDCGTNISTERLFEFEIDAADSGLQSAFQWLDANRPST